MLSLRQAASPLKRNQTMEGVMEWSYSLLEFDEQALLQQVSVFVGGWTLEAAEAICINLNDTSDPEAGSFDVQQLLTSLVDHSLVLFSHNNGGRYSMLETVLQYACKQVPKDKQSALEYRHASFFLQYAQLAFSGLQGPEEFVWLNHLETDHDNLRAVLKWAEKHNTDVGLRLAVSLCRFWDIRGYWQEGLNTLQALMKRYQGADQGLRAKAMLNAGNLLKTLGEYPSALKLLKESNDLFQQQKDPRSQASVLITMGAIAQEQGNHAEAWRCTNDLLPIMRELQDRYGEATIIGNLGYFAYMQDQFVEARGNLEEALDILRQLREQAPGKTFYKVALANTLNNLGGVLCSRDELDRAHEFLKESLNLRNEIGDQKDLPFSFDEFAFLAAKRNQMERAARLWGAAAQMRENALPLPPDELKRHEQRVAVARASLGERSFDNAWQEGRLLTPDEAIKYALDDSSE